jgi:hypothetical protein
MLGLRLSIWALLLEKLFTSVELAFSVQQHSDLELSTLHLPASEQFHLAYGTAL